MRSIGFQTDGTPNVSTSHPKDVTDCGMRDEERAGGRERLGVHLESTKRVRDKYHGGQLQSRPGALHLRHEKDRLDVHSGEK